MVNLRSVVVALSACVLLVKGQGAGTLASEGKPQLTIQTCTGPGACSNVQSSVVLDANWRWVHDSNGQNCYTGNTWASSCNNDIACASTCMLEQVSSDQYMNTYGITTQNGNSLSLQLVTGANVGSRIYLNDGTSDKYMKFHLLNNEFTFDVDTSKEVCGLNGALYFVEMDADGGLSKYPGNKAGSKYGTGYCDAQCPQDLKFINGQANVEGWTPSSGDKNSGMGNHGSCCAEMDIWEANNMATAYTPHPCSMTGQQMCQDGTTIPCAGSSSQRYNGICDRDGCDFNAYRSGNTSFYGPGKTLDTNSPMTVVTQFVTSDGTNTGDLVEIRRAYVQNGKTIWNANSALTGLCNANSIDTNFCNYQKALFGDQNDFATKGGLKQMGQAMKNGMVLTMSLWVDYAANCLWLDSAYPTNKDASLPGVKRGECATNSGVPAQVIQNSPSSKVTFSNIRFGPIGSTTPGVPNQGPYTAKPCSSGATPAPSSASNTASNTGANTNANTASTGGSNTNAASNTGANTNTNTGASTNAATNTGASNSGASSSPIPTSSPNCPIGAETCPCTAGGACNSGLTCLSKLCVKSGHISNSASTVAVSALAVTAAAALSFAF